MTYQVDFQPIGRRGEFSGEDTLLDCARRLSVDLVSICGGVGSCERCKVQVVSGRVSRLSIEEQSILSDAEIQSSYRLACMTYPEGDVVLHVPPESLTAPQRTQVEGVAITIEPDPVVRGVIAELVRPTLENPVADASNLWAALAPAEVGAGRMDVEVLQAMPAQLRKNDWRVNAALRGDEIVAIGGGDARWVGLAVDIGTTKIAGYLIDLASGERLAAKGIMNPQISYGEDVVSRIVAASKSPADAELLQSLLVDALNDLVRELCEEAGVSAEQVVEAVVVGNTAIHHLFLRLPVKQLGVAPYVPVVRTAVELKARDLGLKIAPGAYIHLLPNIAGYVGADHIAMLLATGMGMEGETTLAIDIGTNTEICLRHAGALTSVSCASGPAFEGAHIKFGMRAAPGAIEYVRFKEGHPEIQTIGGEAPVGICGSGLLDAVAGMRQHGVIDRGGKMGGHPLVTRGSGATEFILAERPGLDPITISQKDVRELQLAKAAIRVGVQTLVEAAGIREEDLAQVIIAGAFGTFIDVRSAILIGMLPDIPLERYQQVGNAAGTGACLALISKTERERGNALADHAGYIELAGVSRFNRKFAEATYL